MAYHILSLSGGGVRGIFQAVCLREIAKLLTKPLSSYFDLIAGTSTGAIIALGVALNVDPARIVDLFRVHGPKIFSRRSLADIRKGPRYPPQPLREALTEVFGNRRLNECKPSVAIAATTLNRFQIRVFTTIPRKERELDLDLSVVDVIMASCAAPTFFPPVRPTGGERYYVDGGIWANSPSLMAAVWAYTYAQALFRDIRLVSIGNGKFPEGAIADEFSRLRPVSREMISSLFDMMFATQNDMAEAVLEKLITRPNMLQIDTELKELISLDDAHEALRVLPSEAEGVARNRFNELKQFLKPQTNAP